MEKKDKYKKMLYKEYLQKQNANYNYVRHTLSIMDGLAVSMEKLKDRLFSEFERKVIDRAIDDLKKSEVRIFYMCNHIKDDMNYTKSQHAKRAEKKGEKK